LPQRVVAKPPQPGPPVFGRINPARGVKQRLFVGLSFSHRQFLL
jgi:hypothetical protein